MKNKKVKGFTLIELLAIIVILAIIAVITIPIILNVIENSRMGAVKDSAYGYKDAVSKYYVTKLYENSNLKLDGEYTITNGKMTGNGMDNIEIPVTGNVPSSGSLLYKNNVLESGYLIFGEYKVTIENGEIISAVKSDITLDDDSNDDTGNDESSDTAIGGFTNDSQLVISVNVSREPGPFDTKKASISVELTPSISTEITYYYYIKSGSNEYLLEYSGIENEYKCFVSQDILYYVKVVAIDSSGKSISAEKTFTP